MGHANEKVPYGLCDQAKPYYSAFRRYLTEAYADHIKFLLGQDFPLSLNIAARGPQPAY